MTKKQHIDSGLALILLLLLFNQTLIAIVIVLITMTKPQLISPFTRLWFGLSTLLGLIVPKFVLTVLFCLVVTPIGLSRRLYKWLTGQSTSFKSGTGSLYTIRNKVISKADLLNQF